MRKIKRSSLDFLRDQSGAVTVDWVVLTAAIVGLGLAAFTTSRSGVTSVATTINTGLASAEVSLP